MEIEDESATPKRKRGIRNINEYSREVIKKSRVKGTEYKSWSGALVPAINQGPDCK